MVWSGVVAVVRMVMGDVLVAARVSPGEGPVYMVYWRDGMVSFVSFGGTFWTFLDDPL
jgi:hypothetical protein